MTTNQVRRRFIRFFEKRGHTVWPSDSLVPPREDKSLLFTGAGMNQFKPEFAGRPRYPFKSAVTSQKCIRTDDIPEVGKTPFHHTFFEMLGNFSFGHYFKKGAIEYAWEFLLEDLKLPPGRLVVSVHDEDDESFEIWKTHIGLSPDIIYRFGDKENFWPADAPKKGPNGLCGPCGEIFYDWGEDAGCGRPECDPSCDCARFSEIWNLVFQQFERKDGGVLHPLPQQNIDTGAGLERIAAVMQGVLSNFDIDIFVPIIQAIEREIGRSYNAVRDEEAGMWFRRIADHVRAVVFCISDGILPSNQSRGYVERKLIRRAALDAIHLGKNEPVLFELVPVVAQVMAEPYPEVAERRENIARIIRLEEQRFHETLRQGSAILEEMMDQLRNAGKDGLAGEDAFRLFDTYGLPLDITESILEDVGLGVDREGFEREMSQQRARARSATRLSTDIFGSGPVVTLKESGAATEFTGYESAEGEGKVLGILCGDDLVEIADQGKAVTVVLDRSTFYAESGGEVADAGTLEGEGGAVDVADAQWAEGMILHAGKVSRGSVRVGDVLHTRPATQRRAAVRRNHTATHLLHHALRRVLGRHAEQAGSLVAPDHLRFDFTHVEAMTRDQIERVEDLVNERIRQNAGLSTRQTTVAEAKKEGAMALFGEKYGERVRMVSIGDFSKELCGGLHCAATGDIGLFRIVSEQSVAAGVRRIEAVTGPEAVDFTRERERLLTRLAAALGSPVDRAPQAVERLKSEIADLRRQVQRLRQRRGPASASDLVSRADRIGETAVIVEQVSDVDASELRKTIDALKRDRASVAVVLGTIAGDRVQLAAGLTPDLVQRGLDAAEIVRECATLVRGGGGGRPDMAQAGGAAPDQLPAALAKAKDILARRLESGLQSPD